MERCPYILSVSAYHDGELVGARRVEVEAHLSQCPICVAELEELRALTRAMEGDVVERVSANAMWRMHEHVEELTSERSDYRFAQLLSGIAAAVLIGVGGWLLAMPAPVEETAPEWERAAVMLRPDVPTAESAHPAQRVVAEFAMQRSR